MNKIVLMAAVLAGICGAFAFKSLQFRSSIYAVANLINWPGSSANTMFKSSITFLPSGNPGEYLCDQLVNKVCKVTTSPSSIITNNPDGTLTITNVIITKGEHFN